MGNLNIITASGTDQATAAPIVAEGQIFTVDVLHVPSGSGVRLHQDAYNFAACLVRNSGLNTLLVYPPPNGTIDRVTTPKAVFSEGLLELWAFSRLDWVSIQSGSAPPSYLVPAFTSFAISGQPTALEIGDSVSAGSHDFTWSTSNSVNVEVNSVGITDTTASIVLASGLSNDGSEAITLSAITNTVPATQTWTINAIDTHATTFSRTFSVNWYERIYAGDSASATLNSAGVLALELNPLKSSQFGDYAVTLGTNYKYIAYPDSMGDISSIVDPQVGQPISMATVLDDASYSHVMQGGNGLSYALVTVTNTFGVAVSYRVLRTENIIGGALVMRVS